MSTVSLKNFRDRVEKIAREEDRSPEAVANDMLSIYERARFKARLQAIQDMPLPPKDDPEMKYWDDINRLVHEGRTGKRAK